MDVGVVWMWFEMWVWRGYGGWCGCGARCGADVVLDVGGCVDDDDGMESHGGDRIIMKQT